MGKQVTARGLMWFLLVQHGWADVVRSTGPHHVERIQGRTVYGLNLEGCPFEFSSRPNAYVGRNSMDSRSGGYSHENFRKQFDLGIRFHCVQTLPVNRCAAELAIKEDDASTLRLMQVVKYAHINPRYGGDALATTFTAVKPPRSRELIFCLSDERRTLFGRSIAGNEHRAHTREVLQIIRSIRFTD